MQSLITNIWLRTRSAGWTYMETVTTKLGEILIYFPVNWIDFTI